MGSCSSSCTRNRERQAAQLDRNSDAGNQTISNQEAINDNEQNIIADDDSNLYQIPNHNTALNLQPNNNYYNSLSSSYSYYVPPTGKNKKIKKEFYSKYFKFDKKITEEQLNMKREEFWDTAHYFDGKLEIWNALRAAVDAAENKNFQLAQAIIDSANIILPNGYLNDCYDELGNRYQIPIYVLTKPINIVKSTGTVSDEKDSVCLDDDSSTFRAKNKKKKKGKNKKNENDEDDDDFNETNNEDDDFEKYIENSKTFKMTKITNRSNEKSKTITDEIPAVKKANLTDELFQIKLRVSNSTNENDIKMNVSINQTVASLKTQLKDLISIDESSQRMFFGGKTLKDRERLKTYKLRRNVVVQVIVRENEETF